MLRYVVFVQCVVGLHAQSHVVFAVHDQVAVGAAGEVPNVRCHEEGDTEVQYPGHTSMACLKTEEVSFLALLVNRKKKEGDMAVQDTGHTSMASSVTEEAVGDKKKEIEEDEGEPSMEELEATAELSTVGSVIGDLVSGRGAKFVNHIDTPIKINAKMEPPVEQENKELPTDFCPCLRCHYCRLQCDERDWGCNLKCVKGVACGLCAHFVTDWMNDIDCTYDGEGGDVDVQCSEERDCILEACDENEKRCYYPNGKRIR